MNAAIKFWKAHDMGNDDTCVMPEGYQKNQTKSPVRYVPYGKGGKD